MINILITIFIGCGLGLVFTEVVDRIEARYVKTSIEQIINEIEETR